MGNSTDIYRYKVGGKGINCVNICIPDKGKGPAIKTYVNMSLAHH